MNFLVYILVGWGLTDILVNGSILNSIRNYFIVKSPVISKLLTCIQCSGFWVGILLGILSQLSLIPSQFGNCYWIFGIFASGFLVSGSSVIINSLVFNLLSPRFKNNSQSIDEKD